jgi:hypothetical protein
MALQKPKRPHHARFKYGVRMALGVTDGKLGSRLDDAETSRLLDLDLDPCDSIARVIELTSNLPPSNGARGVVGDNDLPTALTAPLFYDQTLLLICRHCEINKTPSVLRRLCERELVIPVVFGEYSAFPDEVVAILADALHISPYAMWVIMERRFGGTDEDLSQIDDGTALARAKWLLAHSAALGGVPQFRILDECAEQLSRPYLDRDAITAALGVSYLPDLPPIEYLNIIEPYRGSLGFLLRNPSSQSVDEALDRVEQINAQVRKVSKSRRVPLFEVGTRLFIQDTRRIVETLLGAATGLVLNGPGGAIVGGVGALVGGALIENTMSEAVPRAMRTKIVDRIAAHVLGGSVEAIQVWNLRRKLGRNR